VRPEEHLFYDSPLALEEALYDRLSPVARRQSWLRRWLLWAAVLAAATLAGLALGALDEHLGWGGPGWWVLLVLGVVGALVAAHWRVEHDPPDLRALTLRIERAHPELRGLLLTAIAQLPDDSDGHFGYLQEQVLREAVAQSLPGDWARAVPTSGLWGAGLTCALAAVSFLWVAARTWLPELPPLFADEYGLTVTPGNGEVERGMAATVLGRFAGTVPTRTTLLIRPRGKAPVRVAMVRNLADPVFAAMVPVEDGVVDYQLEYAGRRSRRYRLTSFVLPELERVDARIVYPRQPSIAPKEIVDVRQISLAEGARVALTVHLNKPVAEARLLGDDGSIVNLAPSGGRGEVQTATLDPDRTRRYEVQLLDERRRPSRTPPHLLIEVHGNTAPKIALSFPGHDVRVSPLEELTVEAAVSDDVGLTGYGVSYSLAGKATHDVTLGGGNARTQTARLVIPLETLGAQPDDLLSYHFWAEDVAGNGEPRRVWSDMYFAEVRPFEERYQEGSSAGASAGGEGRGPAAADLARREKDIINATWRLLREEREGVPAQELGNDIEVVRKGQMEVKEAADGARAQALGDARAALDEAITHMVRAHGQLAVELSKGLDAEQSAYAALLRLRLRDHQVAREQGGQGSGSGSTADRALDELELKTQANRYETRPEATAASEDPAREDRQVLNRLRDLAERQKTLTDRIKELQVALQQAKSQEREDLERRLKRLREEQQEMLGDMDDLLQRMDRPENRSRLAEARDELERTRNRAAETSEALARGETGRAVGSGTRTERALDRMRETLSRKVSRGLSDELRELREQAQELQKTQDKLGAQIRRAVDPARTGPATPTEGRGLAQGLRQQRQSLSALLDRMRRITEEAEASSPLLSRKLYDAYRRAKLDGVERSLDRMSDMLDHSFGPQAAPEEARAREGIATLQKGVTDAAKGVLGDDAAALKLAQSELQALIDEARGGAPGAAAGTGATAGAGAGPGPAQRPSPGSSTPPSTPPAARGAGLLGENFRSWAERLRDVQELLEEPGLRTDAGRVLDRARVLRGDLQRHGETPQWSLLETEVVRPLSELRDKVNEELRRVAPDKDTLAPIDRDPVPSRYSDLVRRYWKSLSKD
jgi:hypothetical protein